MLDNRNLYHFTSAKIAIDYILKNNEIRFSNLYNLNDPKESRSWPFKIYDEIDSSTFTKVTNDLFNQIDDYIKKTWFVACFKEEFDVDKNDDDSMKRAFYDMRMWAQYGDNHKGVCLIFDHDKFISSLNKDEKVIHFEGKINYLETRPQILPDPFRLSYRRLSSGNLCDYIDEISFIYNRLFFFTKFASWRDENEYRVVIHKKNCDKEYFFHPLDDSISGVIVGNSISDKDLNAILDIAKGKFPVYHLITQNWESFINEMCEDRKDAILMRFSYDLNFPVKYYVLKTCTTNGKNIRIHIDSKSGTISTLE